MLGNAPDARFLRWRYQHVGIFWRYLTLKFAFSPKPNLEFAFSPTPTPDTSQWSIGCVGSQCKMLALAMYISCFLCRFHLHLVPNANPISSGIWTLDISNLKQSGAGLKSLSIYHIWVMERKQSLLYTVIFLGHLQYVNSYFRKLKKRKKYENITWSL